VIVPVDLDESSYLNEIIQKVKKIELRVLRDSVEVAKEQYERFIKPLNTNPYYSSDSSSDSSESRIETTEPLNQAQKMFDPGSDSDSSDSDSYNSNYGTLDDLILPIHTNTSPSVITSVKTNPSVVTYEILNKTYIGTDTRIYDVDKPFSITTPISFSTSVNCEVVTKSTTEKSIKDLAIARSKFLEDIKTYVPSDSSDSDSESLDNRSQPDLTVSESTNDRATLTQSDSFWEDWNYPC
jgi:hypothetical protein